MKLISKSRFLQYLICPKDAWFRLHEPESKEFEASLSEKGLMDQGYVVESYAKKSKQFSGLVEIKSVDFSEFKKEVDQLIAKKVSAIYQPTFVIDGFICRCDFVVYNSKTKKWDIYEVKGTNSLKDTDGPRDHISDVAFQAVVLERYGIAVGNQYIFHLNKEYIRGDKIDAEQLFITTDITDQVLEKKEKTAKQMNKAKKYLNQDNEPKEGCDCIYHGRSSHCETFSKSHPEASEYSIYDLSRINSKKLTNLIKNQIYKLDDIKDIGHFFVI